MENFPSLSLDLSKQDHMLKFYIKDGYRHFRLSPSMLNMFLFHYKGKFIPLHCTFSGGGKPTLAHEVHGYPASVLTECPSVPRLGIFG